MPRNKKTESRWLRARGRIVLFVLVAILLALGYNLAMGKYGFVNLLEIEQQITELEAREVKLNAEMVDLEVKRERLVNDTLYIEKLARERYQLRRLDETVIEY
jgi:cell division protein FtsB